jgi:hypothetical protein
MENLDIAYYSWIGSMDKMKPILRNIKDREAEVKLYTVVCGNDPLLQYVDIETCLDDCNDLSISIHFPGSGAYLLPLPDGFQFITDDLDMEIEDEFGPREDSTN